MGADNHRAQRDADTWNAYTRIGEPVWVGSDLCYTRTRAHVINGQAVVWLIEKAQPVLVRKIKLMWKVAT